MAILGTGLVRATWNANAESDLAGYFLYVGRATGVYDQMGSPLDMGNVTTFDFAVDAPGFWYFALTAYDTAAQESSVGTEVEVEFVHLINRLAICG